MTDMTETAAAATPTPTCPCCATPERSHALSVAPMIEVTDRHFRMLIRIIAPGASPHLWSEMTWDRAILYNAPSEPEFALNTNACRPGLGAVLGFSAEERPLTLQLGGSDPQKLARAARLAEAQGYDEINLNCGCPAQTRGRSRNCFGARLMREPETVAACCAALCAAVSLPVTVKMRLGVDEHDSYAALHRFVELVAAAGVAHFVVHARAALLGLDTAKNRSVPPLRHEWAFALLDDFPHLRFSINGGVGSLEHAAALLQAGAHGVMIGRRANADPYMFAGSRAALGVAFGEGEGWGEGGGVCARCGSRDPPTRREVLRAYSEYALSAAEANWAGTSREQTARSLLTPLTGLFYNTPAARVWKQAVSARLQDKEGLAASSVPDLIAACVEELSRSSAALARLLDSRPPPFRPGSLSAEATPPQRPCLVERHHRAGGGSHGDERPRRSSAGARQKEKRAPAHADSAPATMAMAARPWDWNSAAVAALTLALAAAAARAALRPRGTLV